MKRLSVIAIALITCMTMTAVAQTAKRKTAPTKTTPQAKKRNTGLIGGAMEKTSQDAAYGMAGCGLGSVLFGESENRGGQILASTTNDVYSNNTFGMSSGTSNCVPEKSTSYAEAKKNMDMFVAANKEALANDIAKSNGETVLAISNIMGCSDSAYLGAKLQARYEVIFDADEDLQVSDNMLDTVTTDRYLTENCKL